MQAKSRLLIDLFRNSAQMVREAHHEREIKPLVLTLRQSSGLKASLSAEALAMAGLKDLSGFKRGVLCALFLSILSTFALEAQWAEETLATLTLEQKVGQLFMISAEAAQGIEHYKHLIQDKHVGGIIFFKGSPEKQVELINHYQAWSSLPLLIGQDAEWGLSMRLTDAIKFPQNMTLGAIQDDDIIYRLGKMIGEQCRTVGVHINFAPVVDVNSNPNNPIIGMRSFGSNKEAVAHKGLLIMRGMQDGGVLTCAKHFPGHGDTIVDSHVSLPLLHHSLDRLKLEELYPFSRMIKGNVDGVMVAHCAVPCLDASYMPSSLSGSVVTKVLREQLNFEGLIVTDSMSMKALGKVCKPTQACVQAIKAGDDIILCPLDVERSIQAVINAVWTGEISQQELDQHVLRILKAKEHVGLHKKQWTDTRDIKKRLHTPEAQELKKQAYQKAITVIRNESSFLPLMGIKPSVISIVDVASPKKNHDATAQLALNASDQEKNSTLQCLQESSTIIVRIFKASLKQGVFGKVPDLAPVLGWVLDALIHLGKRLVIVLCTSPYALSHLPASIPTVVAYEPDDDAVQAAMDVIWGSRKAEGVLPIHY